MAESIDGFDERDFPLVDLVSQLVGRFCTANGMEGEQYAHTAVAAVDNAGELIFTTIRRMGIVPEEGLDAEVFRTTAETIIQQNGISL